MDRVFQKFLGHSQTGMFYQIFTKIGLGEKEKSFPLRSKTLTYNLQIYLNLKEGIQDFAFILT